MSAATMARKVWIKHITGLLILKILQGKPAYGNQIADEMKRVTRETVKPNPNFIYPLLRQMEREGYVEGSWENPGTRGKRIYTITESGRRYFEELRATVKEKFLELERCHKIMRSVLFEELEEVEELDDGRRGSS